MHEDNHYFNSGKKGLWSRTGYAVESGILARHNDGKRCLSVSQLGGVTAGAFLSRYWQPPKQHSPHDAAVSFGISMVSNMDFGVVNNFYPIWGGRLRTSGSAVLAHLWRCRSKKTKPSPF